MMYNNNFVVVVKHRGKILREHGGIVTLPFGEEYNLLLKNLEARKAVVKISVDSEDVLDNNSIIIQPNSDLELKGFMKGTCVKNRFKFIQKTEEIINHRGDRVDDGVIRVEFKFEKKKVTENVKRDYWYDPIPWRPCVPPCFPGRPYWYGSSDSTADGCSYYSMSSSNVSYDSSSSMKMKSLNVGPLPDEGITVKGSRIRQDFVVGHTNDLEEQASVIVIRLRGTKNNGVIVEKPITVKNKLICPTCGRKNRSINKFCFNCGTFLE